MFAVSLIVVLLDNANIFLTTLPENVKLSASKNTLPSIIASSVISTF